MSLSHTLLKNVRLLHLYFGVFISPALLFFAFTGVLQTFSLHETTRGSSYKPPAWAVTLGQIHKKQTPVVPVKKLPPPEKPAGKTAAESAPSQSAASVASKPAEATAPRPHNPLPLKIFFLIVAIGLFSSVCSGLYMSYKFVRNKALISALLFAGAVIPVLLVLI
jgi:hypothetical protein